MPIDFIAYFRLIIIITRRLKWFFIAGTYASLAFTLQYRAALIVLPFALVSCIAYVLDREREQKGMDDFHGDWLFFRYGQRKDWAILAIPVRQEWTLEETEAAAQNLRLKLAEGIAARLPKHAVQVLGTVIIADKETDEKKEFLRVVFRSRFGSMVSFFVHYAAFGNTITAQYFTYFRGPHTEWSVVRFILESPFTVWFWGFAWLLNRFSIIANISRPRESSFDSIDLNTMYSVSHRVIYEETADMLREAGLLTESVSRQIIYQIESVQNLQSVSFNNSGNAAVGSLSQSKELKTVRPAAQPAA